MPTEFAFRVSTYLTLALACACLGYAEWDLLPEVTGFMGVVLVLLIVSFKYEGRIELSLARANALGLGIAVVGVAWLAVKWTTPATGLMADLSWPTNILPYAGPVLMVLIPAKLFRPKHVGDWWAMQGVGLAAVGLAAAMADDELFVALLCLYLFFAVLSLTQFYYRRSGGAVAPPPNVRPGPRPTVVFAQSNVNPDAPPPYRFAAGRSLRWIGAAVLLAAPLFLLTPRSGVPSWGLSSKRVEVGYNPEQTLEMNRLGDLQTSREVACDVTAEWLDGRPMNDLDPNSYWRGKAYRGYENGRWTVGRITAGMLARFQPRRGGDPADAWKQAGRDPFVVEVKARGRSPAAVAHSPVAWVGGADSPINTVTQTGRELPWALLPDGHLAPTTGVGRERYRQAAVAPLEPGLGPAFPRTPSDWDYDRWVAALTTGPPDGIRVLAERLLRRWIADGTYELPADTLADDRPGQCRVAPARRQAVAFAFRDHLASSGAFTYSTKLGRADKKLDPIEDFLLNVQVGHCEWFAAGHVLLLRSVGVPCQFVLGFRGQEWVDDGRYEILEQNAHAWAEVLIERPATDGTVLHWLTVDPTAGADTAATATRGWWETAREKGRALVADYIFGYSPEKQRKAIADGKAFAAAWWPALSLPLAAWLVWRTRRRWLPVPARRLAPHPLVTSASPPWFLDYLTVTARLGLLPPTGQTPKEFAEAVAAALRASPLGAAVAEVPAYLTSKFYRVRYGGTPLTAAEEGEVRAAVARLLAAVQDLSVLAPAGG
jgi:hypothetical protein